MIALNQKLIILENNKIIFETSDTQCLYLYPLTLKDYVDNLTILKPIKLDIINIEKDLDYKNLFNSQYLDNLLCVEIHIDKLAPLDTITKIISILKKRKIKISLNVKDLVSVPSSFIQKVSKYISYFKIFWNYKDIDNFNNNLNIIRTYNKDALIHVKSYLDLHEISNYENYISLFKRCGVNIYQLSKELLPINMNNKVIDDKYEVLIRDLEAKYNKGSIIFKSVKNLKELYYPRFELDDRNSRNCYACRLKPYLYNDLLLPCKVNDKIHNLKSWGLKDFNNTNNFKKCGIKCSDCASIYENDMLDRINNIINNKKVTIKMRKE